ncbi:MAG: tol-pal system protein YbgF [Acidobacteria bacterium]|nr:tol-pal system protein YbgF [Acidobacteriota bacterium]
MKKLRTIPAFSVALALAALSAAPSPTLARMSRADRESAEEARREQQHSEQVRRSSQRMAEVLIQEEMARLRRQEQKKQQQMAQKQPDQPLEPAADSGLESVFGRNEHLSAPNRSAAPFFLPSPSVAASPTAVSPVVASPVATPATVPPGQARIQPNLELFHSGYSKYSQGDYMAARRDFASFLTANPGDELADSAQYWLGQCAAAQGDDETALAEYRRVIASFPFGDKVPDALLKSGDMLSRMGRESEARQTWQELMRDFPQSGAARRAQTRLSDLSS